MNQITQHGSSSRTLASPVRDRQSANHVPVDESTVRKYVISASSGTALEYFDFAIYGLAAALIFNPLFFPNVSPLIGFLASFATFAVGFLARFIGGVVLGYYGDKLGRKFVLVVTIGLMGVSTVLIGCLPTYDQIGLLAPVLLVVLRICQGFGAGAEIAGATTLLVEIAPIGKRGYISSFVSLGTNVGTIIALGVWMLVSMLPEESLLSWGWRIPFLASIGVVIYTLWLRRNLEDSPAFSSNAARQEAFHFPSYMRDLLKNGRRSLISSVGLRIGESGPSSFYQVFLVGYVVTTLQLDRTVATSALLITSIICFAIIPLVGKLSDHFGRRKMYLFFTAWSVLWCVPALLLVNTGKYPLVLLAFLGGYGVGVVGTYVVQLAYLPELFGSKYRNGGLATSKELGGLLSGGLVPVVSASLMAFFGSVWIVAGYIMFLALVAFITALRSPETMNRDLVDAADAI
ncbi:MFS transporter [Pseudomonas auratipiscis]|uniref:MFS transporter n=1 Tax=Pseudomonas auratipiscis TaxID=3115853 RepID=A0AB35WUV8_9PSED|nr:MULTISPECIES: MFS transporter [unclassified Pseudomonas]MEE1865879.1 MFS transporter [Pseudomonas sp. 120P]MEE1956952.1 MFS transporter [Pseudomonas sp. 119P]